MNKSPDIDDSWKQALAGEFKKPYILELKKFLRQEKHNQKVIYPKGKDIFAAFNLTPLDKVKVVILGQDPYHGANQAHGLCFSVQPGVAIPPSLRNIYQELNNDLGIPPIKHGYLAAWARQGILMLNSVLTVEHSKPASHQKRGWEIFTDSVIAILNKSSNPLAFILWGSYAQKKGAVINQNKHLVIKSAHPSPLSAHRGFFGSKPFSKINSFLTKNSLGEINWQLPENI